MEEGRKNRGDLRSREWHGRETMPQLGGIEKDAAAKARAVAADKAAADRKAGKGG